MEKIEIGYTVPKERWQDAAQNLRQIGETLAYNLMAASGDGRGAEDADDLRADFMLACTAINYVAEFAVDKCRFIPIPGGGRQAESE